MITGIYSLLLANGVVWLCAWWVGPTLPQTLVATATLFGLMYLVRMVRGGERSQL